MRTMLTAGLEVCGAALCAYGISLVSLPASLIVGGAFVVAIGWRNG